MTALEDFDFVVVVEVVSSSLDRSVVGDVGEVFSSSVVR